MRLRSVLRTWNIPEYGLRPYTNGGYEVILTPHPVVDLSPLKGFPIKSLQLVSTGAKDLSPLAGMPLEKLAVDGACDLSTLLGFPLDELCIESGKTDLQPLAPLKLRKLILSRCDVKDLSPLKGIPLRDLTLLELSVADLNPLQGLPLTNLLIMRCSKVADLAFVKDMPLESIIFDERKVTNGLAELRSLQFLTQINGKPAVQFWRRQDVLESLRTRMQAGGLKYRRLEVDDSGLCTVQLASNTASDLSLLKGAPIKSLSLAGTTVEDLAPLDGMPLQSLELPLKRVTRGIEAIRKMSSLKQINRLPSQRFWIAYDSVDQEAQWVQLLKNRGVDFAALRVTEDGQVLLNLNGKKNNTLIGLVGIPINGLSMQLGQTTDLSPLKGMPLTQLWVEDSPVSDLSALEGMRIKSLNVRGTRVKDLSPLKGMPLGLLYIMGTQVEDLSPLAGMPLYELNISNTQVRDLSPLKGMKLSTLSMSNIPVTDLGPIAGMHLFSLFMSGTRVTDISPVKNTPITTLGFDPENISEGMDDLRRLKSLKTVVLMAANRRAVDLSVSEFWKRYDNGDFRPKGQ